MTTTVVVKANHGWPVKVVQVDPKTGAPLGDYATSVVEKDTERTFCVHSGADLHIHEVQPDDAPRGLTFGDALAALKAGKRVAREGWNGKGMWLSLSGPNGPREIASENFWSKHNSDYARENGGSAKVLPCITMKTATGEILMGWLASQTDMLADDWALVPE